MAWWWSITYHWQKTEARITRGSFSVPARVRNRGKWLTFVRFGTFVSCLRLKLKSFILQSNGLSKCYSRIKEKQCTMHWFSLASVNKKNYLARKICRIIENYIGSRQNGNTVGFYTFTFTQPRLTAFRSEKYHNDKIEIIQT